MNISSAVLVALSTLELMYPAAAPQAPAIATTYQPGGKGELAVVVDSSSVIGSVPRGAQRISMLTLNLSASCDAPVTVQSIDIKHTGLGSAADIAGVYALDGFRRITRSATFDVRSQRATLRFRAFTIPACSAANFHIYADMSTESAVGSEHRFTVSGVGEIQSTAAKTTLALADSTAKVISATTNEAKLSVRLLTTKQNVSYGHIETVARVQLSADSRGAHLLRKITFTNKGGARDMDLQYLYLETLSGQKVTRSAARMHAYTALLEFDPTFVIHAGETRVFNLKAEIRGSQSKKIEFEIEEPSDVVSQPYRDR